MRRYAVLFLALLALAGTPGCNTAFARQFRSDPLAAVIDAVSYSRTALSIARGAVAVYAAVSGDSSVVGTFEQLAGQVDRGLLVAQDGARVASEAGHGASVDALMSDAKTAMVHVNAFLNGLPTPAGGAAIPQLRDARQATARAAGLPASGQ